LSPSGRPKSRVVAKYLARYAEPEARDLSWFHGQWDTVVCIPACQEEDSLVETLEKMSVVKAADKTLVIVVINGSEDADPSVHQQNKQTADQLKLRCEMRGGGDALGKLDQMSVLLLDRYSEERRLPQGQGVGLARKIACDVALALVADGRVRDSWIRCTDADVEVPDDYFSALPERLAGGDFSAAVYPFVHVPEGDELQKEAMRLYEVYLHYYVAGLKRAGSPYAYHTIGSLIAINATSYAVVRGFPKRQAGEDFYLLNKLAKVGRVVQAEGTPVRIRGRVSHRVPFGTGAAVQTIRAQLAAGADYQVYHPKVFDALGAWLRALHDFSNDASLDVLRKTIHTASDEWGETLILALEGQGAFSALHKASQQVSGEQLFRRLMEWFDAFRTMKLIHALRDMGLGEVSLIDLETAQKAAQ
jgi:hypothetical protein